MNTTLTNAERAICRQLGLTEAVFIGRREQRRREISGASVAQQPSGRRVLLTPELRKIASQMTGVSLAHMLAGQLGLGVSINSIWSHQALDAALTTLRETREVSADDTVEDLLEAAKIALDEYLENPEGSDAERMLANAGALIMASLDKVAAANAGPPAQNWQQFKSGPEI